MWVTKKNILKQTKDNNNREDQQTEQELLDAAREPALQNANAGKPHSVKDISAEVNPQTRIKTVDSNKLNFQMTKLNPSTASDKIEYASNMKQIIVYNPSTTVLKLGSTRVDTNSYEFLVNGMKCAVLPPFNFDVIYYLQETIQAGFIVPIIFAYGEVQSNPVTTDLT